ncbi:hypothetical protein D3C78_591450 [compost metagenome]
MQVIDGVEIDVVQFSDLRLDVAWYGDIDHENRFVPAQLQCTFHRALAQDR